jgi:RNA polymerase sigma-70 factor (ECF subfamily)
VALLDFAIKLSQRPSLISHQDMDRLRTLGLSDEQILEGVLISGLTNFLCSLSTGLGVTPDFAPWKFADKPTSHAEKSSKTSELQFTHKSGAYLKTVERSPADFPPFAFFKDTFGFVPNIFRAQTINPAALEAEANAVRVILLTEDVLSRFQKEAILLVISAANLNTYCVAVHCEMLRALGVPPDDSDQIALDHQHANLSDADKALLDFVLKLTLTPEKVCGEDISTLIGKGFSEEQILEGVVMTALTNFLNTLQMGLGTTPDFAPRLVFPLKEVNPVVDSLRPILERSLGVESAHDDPDADFVARVKAGETDAFEELVRRHGRKIYRSLLAVLGSAAEAEDAVQDAFLKAFEHIGEFEERSKFSTWLVRIAVNTGLQRLRGRKNLESLDEEDEEFKPRRIQAWQDDPERAYSKEELRRLIEKEVMKLPPKYRLALMLRDLEELSTEEAANALGLTVPGLKARVLRGRLMLRESLVPYFSKERMGVTP